MPGFIDRTRVANQEYDVIQSIDRLGQTFEDVRSRLGLSQVIFGAPADHFATEVDEALQASASDSERAAVR